MAYTKKGETRNQMYERRNKKVVSVEVDSDQWERLAAEAKKEERTTAGQLRLLIRRFLDQRGG